MTDAGAGVEIPICFEGIDKWITGVNSRTTCDDLVYALVTKRFHESGKRMLSPLEAMDRYAVFERFDHAQQRQLPGRCKILKILRSSAPTVNGGLRFAVSKTANQFKRGDEARLSNGSESAALRKLQWRLKNAKSPKPASISARPQQTSSHAATAQDTERYTMLAATHSMPTRRNFHQSSNALQLENEDLSKELSRKEKLICDQNRKLQEMESTTEMYRHGNQKDQTTNLKLHLNHLRQQLHGEHIKILRLTQLISVERQVTGDEFHLQLSDSELRAEETVMQRSYDTLVARHADIDLFSLRNRRALSDLAARISLRSDQLMSIGQTAHTVPPANSSEESGRGSSDNSAELQCTANSFHSDTGYSEHRPTETTPTSSLATPPFIGRPPHWHSPSDVSPIGEQSCYPVTMPTAAMTAPNNKTRLLETSTLPLVYPTVAGKLQVSDNNSDTGLSSMHSDEPLHQKRVLETLV